MLHLLCTSGAFAQTTFRLEPQVGGNVSTVCYDYTLPFPTRMAESRTTVRPGLTAGVAASLAHRHVVVAASALFSMQGYVFDGRYTYTDANPGVDVTNYYHQRFRLNYLTVPLTAAYALRADGQGLQFSAGGYAACLLGGRVDYDNRFEYGTQQAVYQASEPARARSVVHPGPAAFYTQRFDAGLQAGAGYRWPRLAVHAAYRAGLRDLQPAFPDDPNRQPTYYTRSAALTISYFWGKLPPPSVPNRRTGTPRYSL